MGKTTLAKQLMARFDTFEVSISHTTRSPRGKEVDGVDYHFITDAEFDRMVERGEFAEWANVHAHRYGTSLATIERLQANGRDIMLDIDYQGVEQLSKAYDDAVTVLLTPPSMEELERRLRGRETDSEAQIQIRMAKARDELAHYSVFRYVVINRNLEDAMANLEAIFLAERRRIERNRDFLNTLVST
ncbi:MAG: guanylate kinase [Myxococcales bacterium]|nr:guanylate kinase [Myxococcales bacterium]